MRLKIAVPMILLLTLCACGVKNEQEPLRFRTALTEAGGCSYDTVLTADFGDYLRQYSLNCDCSAEGATEFTVLAPEGAAGITATVEGEDAAVSYDDVTLAVEEFSSRRISPMAAPHLLVQAWSHGYMESWGMDGDYLQVTYVLGQGLNRIDVVTWFSDGVPVRGEITDGTNRLISCEIMDFSLRKKEKDDGEDTQTDLGGG